MNNWYNGEMLSDMAFSDWLEVMFRLYVDFHTLDMSIRG